MHHLIHVRGVQLVGATVRGPWTYVDTGEALSERDRELCARYLEISGPHYLRPVKFCCPKT